jgi:hypothetical protein
MVILEISKGVTQSEVYKQFFFKKNFTFFSCNAWLVPQEKVKK